MRSERRDWRAEFFSVAITLVSRVIRVHDALWGRTRSLAKADSREQFFFASGTRRLAGVWVAGAEGAPVVLLCHGIGETSGHWNAVQALLAEHGVGSMFFNYSGYGMSSGQIRAEHCDEDLRSAYVELRRRVGPGVRVFVLGFSLGSGIAACGVGALTPQPEGLILCEAYTSFREAVCATGVPHWVALGFPDVWNTVAIAPSLELPVLVVHSDRDRLFPVEMAQRIAEACGDRCKLVVVPGLTHNEPYLRPAEAYWGPILQWMSRTANNREDYCDSIQPSVLAARRSKAVTASRRCSSRVSSILLWLMPPSDWVNIITVGMPRRATSAASCRGPDGRL